MFTYFILFYLVKDLLDFYFKEKWLQSYQLKEEDEKLSLNPKVANVVQIIPNVIISSHLGQEIILEKVHCVEDFF